MSTERILVHKDIVEEFSGVLSDTAKALDSRDGFELCRVGAVEGLKTLIEDAREQVSYHLN
jgi:hypothetical protein